MSGFRALLAREKPHFFKIFFPDLIGRRLGIPRAFMRHIEVGNRGLVCLTGPSGNNWVVELVNDTTGLFLEKGWENFVMDHSISRNDFLLFRYEGDLHFSVMIFDVSACEKGDAFLAIPCQDIIFPANGDTSEKTVVDTTYTSISASCNVTGNEKYTPDAINGSCAAQAISAVQDIPLQLDNEKTYCEAATISNKLDNGEASDAVGSPHSEVEACSHASILTQEPKIKEEDIDVPLHSNLVKISGGIMKDDSPERSFYSGERNESKYIKTQVKVRMTSLISNRLPVTEEEVKMAYEEAKLFKSDHPTALVVMRDSYVYYGFYMNLPISFVRDHLPKHTQMVKLWDPKGKSWMVNYVFHRGYGGLSARWGAFSQANNLERDDVCIFELICENEMRVHIFRVVKELNSLSQEMTKHNSLLEVQKRQTRNHTLIEKSVVPVLERSPSIVPMNFRVLSANLKEPPVSSEKILEQLKSLKGPRFEITMKRHNIFGTAYVRIPSTFESFDYMMDKDQIIIQDLKEQSWKVCLRHYHSSNGIQIRLSSGWLALCLDWNLEEGDICTFVLTSKGDIPEMVIVVQKRPALQCLGEEETNCLSKNILGEEGLSTGAGLSGELYGNVSSASWDLHAPMEWKFKCTGRS